MQRVLDGDKDIIWELRCDCGNTCYARPNQVTRFGKGKKSCGCTTAADLSKAGQRNRRFTPRESTARLVWCQTYKDAKWETFLTLSQHDCHYCGRPPQLTRNKAYSTGKKPVSDYQRENGSFTYNGLDRIDSSIGHTDDNVIPCCSTCNSMKGAMGYQEFKAHIRQVYRHSCSEAHTGAKPSSSVPSGHQ